MNDQCPASYSTWTVRWLLTRSATPTKPRGYLPVSWDGVGTPGLEQRKVCRNHEGLFPPRFVQRGEGSSRSGEGVEFVLLLSALRPPLVQDLDDNWTSWWARSRNDGFGRKQ